MAQKFYSCKIERLNFVMIKKLFQKSIFKNLGPGFLLAGAAIGVSHLVQATRAGAEFGFSLIWVLLLACLSKYPFLEFGPRFTASTGKDLISGYKELGKFSYYTYIFITFGTMFVIQASVTIVTAGLAEQLFQLGWSPFIWSAIILGFCIALLWIGKYSGLDLSIKIIVTLLTLVTLISVLFAFNAGTLDNALATPAPSYWNLGGMAFLIAFMGWMPIPLDASVWHSMWTREKAKNTNKQLSVKNSFIDFNVGYLSASFIGLLFLLLGALVMFGRGESFSKSSVGFATQLIELYQFLLGNWSYLLVSIAALITMLSTTLTVADAYPRVLSEIMIPQERETEISLQKKSNLYRIGLIAIPILSLAILYFTDKNFTYLVDFASGLSFLSAPILGYFNFRLVKNYIAEKDRPSKNYQVFSWICLSILILFGIGYLYIQFN